MAQDELPISLHDARLDGYSTTGGDDVIVSIIKWDETLLKLRFREVVLLKELVGDGHLEELVECRDSDELRVARQRLAAVHYPAPPLAPFRHFRLLDDSNYPVLDIVCNEVTRLP